MTNRTPPTGRAPTDSAGAAASASKESQATTLAVAADLLSPEERHARISRAAYRRAESRGFVGGGELEDWLLAEREVDLQTAR